MGARMRALDWSSTVLGPLEQWPQTLRVCVRVMSGSGYPMLVCWGPAYTMLYNDAYGALIGKSVGGRLSGRRSGRPRVGAVHSGVVVTSTESDGSSHPLA
jgi:hypothetical protein